MAKGAISCDDIVQGGNCAAVRMALLRGGTCVRHDMFPGETTGATADFSNT